MRWSWIITWVLTTAFDGSSSAFAENRPNIVFLMTDDQSTRSLGCYNAPGVKTPNIDQLAADGVVFERHYDTTAICMASRASVMSGLLEYRHGVNFNTGPTGRDGQMRVDDWQHSYPVKLRNAGYRTGFAGKFGFVVYDGSRSGRYPAEDFDVWGGSPGQTSYQTSKNKSMSKYAKAYPHSTRSYGAFGREFVRESAERGQPFCLSISFKAPHRPVTPDPLDDHVYAGAVFPKPVNFGREHGAHFSEQSRRGRQFTRFEEWGYATQYDAVMAKYYQQIFAVDVAVGMIREAIKEAGVAGETIIIFTSDNGFLCGSHGYGSKVLPYEEASRVPLIIYDPTRVRASKRCRAITTNTDFAPTILAAAGVDGRHDFDGKSLLSLYTGATTGEDRTAVLMNVWGPKDVFSLAVVAGDWKYIYWPSTARGMTPAVELYNLSLDPFEMTNVAPETTAIADRRRLEAAYDRVVDDWAERSVDRDSYRGLTSFFQRRTTSD